MNHSTWTHFRAAALLLFLVVSITSPALADTVTFTFDGWITEVIATPPPPFANADVGSKWTLTYAFNTDTVDVDPNPEAGQYRDAITTMTLTIDDATISGAPGQVIPNQLNSLIAVNLTSRYADYTAQAGLPNDSAWAQVALWDLEGTPFGDDLLPQELPMPLVEEFPDQRDFFLRVPASTQLFLRGEIGQIVFRRVRADIQTNDGPEYVTVDLLVDSTSFGVGGIASGIISSPGSEVMGVEPSPFRWVVDPETGTPGDGEAVVQFMLDPAGEVMGVEPSPFRVLIVSESEILGELDFGNVNGFFPGKLGSLHLTGVRLLLLDGSVIYMEDFDIYDIYDKIILFDMRTDLYIAQESVSLLLNSLLFGSAGLASGVLSTPGSEVMGVEPSPFRWVVDPETGTPSDGEVVMQFNLDSSGEVMGVEPSPFRVLIVSESEILGELDFGNVSGALGSLFLDGVRLKLQDGSYIDMESFEAKDCHVDSDGDGLLDCNDSCPNSDISATVFIDGCDTGVENYSLDGGCTISDLINECAVDANNHGQFVRCVSHLTNDLKREGIISGKEKGKIQRCAAKADIP